MVVQRSLAGTLGLPLMTGSEGRGVVSHPLRHRPSPLATNLSAGRARPENPVELQGLHELATHCACQETADFLSESPNSLQTSAPWRFSVEPNTTSLFS